MGVYVCTTFETIIYYFTRHKECGIFFSFFRLDFQELEQPDLRVGQLLAYLTWDQITDYLSVAKRYKKNMQTSFTKAESVPHWPSAGIYLSQSQPKSREIPKKGNKNINPSIHTAQLFYWFLLYSKICLVLNWSLPSRVIRKPKKRK